MSTGVWLGMGIIGIVMVLLLIAIPVLFLIFWIGMIIDCAHRKFKDKDDKIVWILVIVLLHIVGALIYYFVIKKHNKN